jgi:hypothetical protein
MGDSINWLHLTDIHFGLDDAGWLWPKVKHDFLRDIEKLQSDFGAWDLVFFTGDFTQQAKKEEFDGFNRVLEELWKTFQKGGSAPRFCPVPGNHDLARPLPDSAISKTLTKLWWTDSALREQFWRDARCEYRTAVDEAFSNYAQWIGKLPVPLIEWREGSLPGDFSATLIKGGFKLGMIGLNSTFLQIAGGPFKGKLDIHVSQLNSVCDGDPSAWVRDRTITVLLTHQPPTWLAPQALQHFRQEIYPPGRFFAQFCGHQHEPEAFELSEAGAAPRRLRQGPSVFGLEDWDGATPQKRNHGYSAGQFVLEGQDGFEKLWPRTAVAGRHGGLNICPDHTYKLQNDCVVTPFEVESAGDKPILLSGVSELQTERSVFVKSPEQEVGVLLLEGTPDDNTARAKLMTCPRLPLTFGAQHRFVRQDEQSEFEHQLRKNRCVWVAADWGTAVHDFLGAATDRFRVVDCSPEIFLLRCDEASDIDRFEALFPQQFGMPLQAFCAVVGQLKGCFLLLDEIHPQLCSGDNFQRLSKIINAIIDYCPELRVLLVSRLKPDETKFSVVEVRPLDIPDVRAYVTYHPEATVELREPDVIERLYQHSDGLPMHLDRILKALKVSSLASVLDADLEAPFGGVPEETSKALAHAVSGLVKSEERRTKRSFRLLKVLSVLPYGETLETMSHYLPAEPFFHENAVQLNELALLDVIPLRQTAPHMGGAVIGGYDLTGPKIMKVPRQVRDYVQTLLSEEERVEIVSAGIDRFFGRSWRSGRVKLRSLPSEYREYLTSGVGNEFALIHHLMTQAKSSADKRLMRKAAMLGIQYARHLSSADRYRDLTLVASGVAQLLDQNEAPEEWSQMMALYGTGLRMMGKHTESINYLKAALEVNDKNLEPQEKASIWLDIALAHESQNQGDEAVMAAEKVQVYAKPDSATWFQASTVIAGFDKGDERQKQLREIEKQAREKGYTTVANNMILDGKIESENTIEKIKQLTRVLDSEKLGYNRARAIVAKALAIQTLEKSPGLKPSELGALAMAYAYLHAQRFGSLFNRCHEALWAIFEEKGDLSNLFRLFRHTSFLWRIRGDEAKEADYLKRLSEKGAQTIEAPKAAGYVVELRYFSQRLKAILLGSLGCDAAKKIT